jgi:hypothetical protein
MEEKMELEYLNKRDQSGDFGKDRTIILKWILKIVE